MLLTTHVRSDLLAPMSEMKRTSHWLTRFDELHSSSRNLSARPRSALQLKRAESEVTPFEFKGEGHFVRERLIGESVCPKSSSHLSPPVFEVQRLTQPARLLVQQSSEVYLVKSRNDGQPYALKRSRRTFTGEPDGRGPGGTFSRPPHQAPPPPTHPR